MILTNQQLLVLALYLVLWVISNDAGPLAGLEIKQVNFCDPHDETAKIKIYPWPFLPSGKRFNISVTFTPAVDVFAAMLHVKMISESDGHLVERYRYNVCPKFPDFCSLPAGDTHVWTISEVMTSFPPGVKVISQFSLKRTSSRPTPAVRLIEV